MLLITDGMHYGSVPTLMLAVFKLVKTLITANLCGMRSTCDVHRLFNLKVVVSIEERSFGMKSMH